MEAINSLALLVKNMLKADSISTGSGKIPSIFKAVVKEVDGNSILLAWQNQTIKAKLETTAQKGETLVLQLKEEKDGQLFYRVLARFVEEQQYNSTGWQVLLTPTGNKKPSFLRVQYYSSSKGGETPGSTCLDIVFPTHSFGFVGIRFFSLQKPYPCCFLVEKEEYGKVLQNSASVWFADMDPGDFPVTLQQFRIIDRNELVKDSSLLNHRA